MIYIFHVHEIKRILSLIELALAAHLNLEHTIKLNNLIQKKGNSIEESMSFTSLSSQKI